MLEIYTLQNGVPVIDSTGRQDLSQKDCRVALTVIGEMRVSTVFTRINLASGNGPPNLWETMVFGGPLDQTQQRYSSELDAAVGHVLLVERIKELEKQGTTAKED